MGHDPKLPPAQEGEFRSLSRRAASEFIVDKIPAPTALYIQEDSVLMFNLTNISVAQQNIIVRATMLRSDDGELTTSETIITANAGAAAVNPPVVPLCEGFLLEVSLFGATLNALRGQLYAEVFLARNPTVDTKFIQSLFAGYIIGNKMASWPGNTNYLPADGQGAVVIRGVGNPGAGNEWTFFTNPNTRARLVSLQATFTASAAVATRFPAIILQPNVGQNICTSGDQVGVTASQAVTFSWFKGAMHTTNGTAPNRCCPIPDPCWFRVNSRIQSTTANLQAGDTWTNILMEWEEWVDG